jgi:short subunit dehydrogenase-like uncharacterized protein
MAERKGWLLYGPGYTGTLIAEAAAPRWFRPVIAGRRAEAVRPLAERLGFEGRVFPVEDPAAIAKEIEGVAAVLLAAGPFSKTSGPVLEACLRAGCHYIDITGEIAVLEACAARDRDARDRGITVLPGAGFDVVPTDCLAACLKEALPGANRLALAIHAAGRVSKGTALSMLEGMPEGGASLEGGKIRRVPLASGETAIPFRDGPRPAVPIPWGDLVTAYRSTGIPDIAVYAAASRSAIRTLRLLRPFARLLGLRPVRRLAGSFVGRLARGPSAEERARGSAGIWGKAWSASGKSVEGTLVTPDAYALTARTAIACVERILAGKAPPGFTTPSLAFGPRFILEFEGCDLKIGDRLLNSPN